MEREIGRGQGWRRTVRSRFSPPGAVEGMPVSMCILIFFWGGTGLLPHLHQGRVPGVGEPCASGVGRGGGGTEMKGAGELPRGSSWPLFPGCSLRSAGSERGQRWCGLQLRDWGGGAGLRATGFHWSWEPEGLGAGGRGGLGGCAGRFQGPRRFMGLAVCDAVV